MSVLFAFAFAVLFSFVGVLPPGIVNMTVANYSVKKSLKRARRFINGAILVVFIQSVLGYYFATFLENHPQVNKVKYPFLKSHPQYEIAQKQMKLGGNIVAFEIKGGLEAGRAFLDKIKLCSLSPNLGDTRTIVTHPASTTHSKLSVEERLAVSITDGLVRISVGLETVEDVIADLNQALA